VFDNFFSEETFPNTRHKLPMVQLEAISTCPIACYLGEEVDTHPTITFFQVVVESSKVSPSLLFSRLKKLSSLSCSS